MTRNLLTIFSSLCVMMMLCACGKSAALNPLDQNRLTTLVFAGWSPAATIVQNSKLKLADSLMSRDGLNITPIQVVLISDNCAILLTKGEPLSAGHISGALLGAYWFKRVGDEWSLERRQDEIAWLGSSGNFGDVHAVLLSPQYHALLVEFDWDGMGQENRWFTVFGLGADKVTNLLDRNDDIHLSQHVFGTIPEADCDELLKHPPLKPIRVTDSSIERDEGRVQDCLDLKANWSIVPGKNALADIHVNQVREMSNHRVVKSVSDENGNGSITYELKFGTRRSQLIFHFDEKLGRYRLISGRDLSSPT
jgi:hypothetical protein